MAAVRNKIIVITEDVVALEDNRKLDDFDPNKTIYDLKTESIRKGEHAILVEHKENDSSALILYGGKLLWIFAGRYSLAALT